MSSPRFMAGALTLFLGVLLAGLLLIAGLAPEPWRNAAAKASALTGVYGLLSLITFGLYALDKWAARHGRRRVPELHLQGLSLLGGWPGALLAQTLLRHKTLKTRFRRVFCLSVALNALVLTALLTGINPLPP